MRRGLGIVALLMAGMLLMGFGIQEGTRDGVPVMVDDGVIFARDCDGDGEYSLWIRYEGWEFDSVYTDRVLPAWEVCVGYQERDVERVSESNSQVSTGDEECKNNDDCPPNCVCRNGACEVA